MFFRSTVIEWNNLDKSIRGSESFTLFKERHSFFKKSILQPIWPTPNRTFNWHNPTGIKLITRFRLGLSHLRDHKFKHNFLNCLNPICCCGKGIETTAHYLLHCPIFSDERSIFLNKIQTIVENVLRGSDSRISMMPFLWYFFNDTKDTSMLNTATDCIL